MSNGTLFIGMGSHKGAFPSTHYDCLVQFCHSLSYLLWTVIPVKLINHDVVSHNTLFNWSVLSVYLWWGSGAMYYYPKPNPKSLSDEELQKFKLNKGTE